MTFAVPKGPDMAKLVDLFGGNNFKSELWEDLGKALELSEESLDKIREDGSDDLEKMKQNVLHVSMKSI